MGGQSPAAEGVLNQLEARNGGDPRLSFSVGLVYVEWQLYDRAEKAFSRALESEPVNFDVLYNLGLAAVHSGHLDRAEQVFQVALKQKPEDVDALYNLGRVYAERGRDDQAITFFARAGQLAPERRDVLLSMAQAADRLGYYEDAASAIDRYLKLRPDDDVMRRERGFALARTAKINDALQDLNFYVRKHPKDARGFYELAIAETVQERDMALKHLDRAISLDPNLCAARYARGVLLSQQAKFAESVEDLKLVAGCDPQDYRALGVLGEGYLRLGNDAAAVTALSKAATLAPRNSAVLLQYGRALMKSGRQEEGEAVLEKSKALEPEEARRRPYSGLFSLLSLPPEQQRRRYLATLEKRIAQDPEDASLKARWGQEQLADGKTAEALETFRRVRGMTSSSTILAQCGKALLDREQYGAAQEFLQAAVGVDPSAANTRLNLVVAMFHATGPAAALAELDRIPPVGGRGEGDYYLLRAQVLDAMGKTEEAVDNLNRGFRASPARPDLYFEAALFLIKHARYQEALELITQAKRLVPDAPQLLIAEAVIYEVSQRSDFAQKILEQIQTQWPEWSPPYLLNGVILESHFKSKEARSQLEIALALAGDDATAYYYLALAHTETSPQNIPSAEKAIQQSLSLNPNNAHARSLAGKIALIQKQYSVALDYLTSALRLQPDFVDAHEALSAVYRALGEKEKSIAELKEVLAIKQKNAGTSQSPAKISELLFTVRPPAEGQSLAAPAP